MKRAKPDTIKEDDLTNEEIQDSLPKILTAQSKPKDTLRYYRKRLGFKKPSAVLVDGPVLAYITFKKLSTKGIQEVLKDDRAKILTTNCILQELKGYYYTCGSVHVLESIKLAQTLDVVPCMHKEAIRGQQCIESVLGIGNSRKMFVAVMANSPLVHQDPKIPIIIADNCTFLLKQLSSHEQRLAKKSLQASITNNDLDISPSFERLQTRIKLFGCVGKVDVDEEGNGQFEAISELLLPLVVPCEKVRENVVSQLLSYPKRYQDSLDLEGPEADVQLAYFKYVSGLSRDGERGDECTLQAAADFFQVMFVVITSLEGIAVKEFHPYGMEDEFPEKGLFLSCLYENDEKHYNVLHRIGYDC